MVGQIKSEGNKLHRYGRHLSRHKNLTILGNIFCLFTILLLCQKTFSTFPPACWHRVTQGPPFALQPSKHDPNKLGLQTPAVRSVNVVASRPKLSSPATNGDVRLVRADPSPLLSSSSSARRILNHCFDRRRRRRRRRRTTDLSLDRRDGRQIHCAPRLGIRFFS